MDVTVSTPTAMSDQNRVQNVVICQKIAVGDFDLVQINCKPSRMGSVWNSVWNPCATHYLNAV